MSGVKDIVEALSRIPDGAGSPPEAGVKRHGCHYVFISSDSVYMACKAHGHEGDWIEEDAKRPDEERDRKRLEPTCANIIASSSSSSSSSSNPNPSLNVRLKKNNSYQYAYGGNKLSCEARQS